jgi:hypothetical protein
VPQLLGPCTCLISICFKKNPNNISYRGFL